MSFGLSSRTVPIVCIVCVLLLAACFPFTVAQADGQGGEWPMDPPDPISNGGDDGGGDGVQTLITVMTLMQLLL
jgi:hypothetical protein